MSACVQLNQLKHSAAIAGLITAFHFFYFSLSICSGNRGGGAAYQELRVKDMLAKHSSKKVCGLMWFSEVVPI